MFPRERSRSEPLALVGAIERVLIEWQEGELDVSIDQIVDHLVGLFSAGATVGVTETPSVRPR